MRGKTEWRGKSYVEQPGRVQTGPVLPLRLGENVVRFDVSQPDAYLEVNGVRTAPVRVNLALARLSVAGL